jgi:hypothetical protein
MQLFAFQAAPPAEAEFQTWIFVITIVAMALLFVGFFFWLISRQVAKSREFSHLERMKALELGQPSGPSVAEKLQNKYLHNIFWICFWLGGWGANCSILGGKLHHDSDASSGIQNHPGDLDLRSGHVGRQRCLCHRPHDFQSELVL